MNKVRALLLENAKHFEICPFMSANQLVWNSTYNGCIKRKCALWSERKNMCSLNLHPRKSSKREPSEYNLFITPLLKEGKSVVEAAKVWQEHKQKGAS